MKIINANIEIYREVKVLMAWTETKEFETILLEYKSMEFNSNNFTTLN